MARIRSLNPSFFTDADLAALDFYVRLLFEGLWCHADKEGRLIDKAADLKGVIFPNDTVDVEKGLGDLAKPKKNSPTQKAFILRYEVEGEKYIQILNWEKYQHPHHTERDSDIPSSRSKAAREGTAKTPPPGPKEIDVGLAKLLSAEMKKNNPMYLEKPEQVNSWADEIRLMRTADKRRVEDIRAVILWCQTDPFWRKNIESAATLRKKFARLWLQMKEPGGKPEKTAEELDEIHEQALKDPGR